MRTANLRPLRERPLELSSPSRGETVPGKSLTDSAVQEEFRNHLETRIKEYQKAFPNELGIIVNGNSAQQDNLNQILLEFRKLREGIISAKRQDAFAIETYETSAKLAILAKNIPQVATILPHLVRSLHWPPSHSNSASDSEVSLEGKLSGLKIQEKPKVSLAIRSRFVGYYLIHTLWSMGDYASFQSFLRDLITWDAPSSSSDEGRISAQEPTIVFALSMFRCYSTCDYAHLAKVLENPYGYDKFAWVLIRSNLDKFQSRIWETLRSAYMAVEDQTWLVKTLCLPSVPGSLKLFLEKHEAQNRLDETTGRVLLKQSR